MQSNPIAVVEAMYAARRAKDIKATMAYCIEEMEFTHNVDPVSGGPGETLVGNPACLAHLARVSAVWEVVDTVVGPLHLQGDVVRTQVKVELRHRNSGYILEATKRQDWIVQPVNGLLKIVKGVEVFDAHSVSAFIRMADWSAREAAKARLSQ